MYTFQKLHKQEIESSFFIDSLKAKSEADFLLRYIFSKND